MSKNSQKTVKALLSHFMSNRNGNVAIIFGIILLPLMIAMGSAVDYSRAFLTQRNLATAVDAAVLAGGVFSESSDEEFEAKIRSTLYANFPEEDIESLEFSLDSSTQTVVVTATSKVDTVFAGIWNVNELPIMATASAAPNRQWAEIALVLDNTGSMDSNGKMEALKSAATELVNTLHDTADDPDKLFIGVVPFAGTVRVTAALGSGFGIDENGESSISGEDFDPGNTNVLDLYDAMEEYSWGGCLRARPSGYDLLDTSPDADNPETLFPPYFAPDEPDNDDDNSNSKSKSKSKSNSNSSFYNTYIDDDSPNPGGSLDERQRNVAKYTNVTPDTSSSSKGPESFCPSQSILELTTTRADVIAAIEGMEAQGITVIPTGLAWGWRLVTPGAPYEALSFDSSHKKYIILLTDGQNNVGGGSYENNNSYYTAYGYASEGHLGSTDGSEAEAELDLKISALCTNAKADGVSIYTITFQLSDETTQELFRNCATTENMYFDSPDNDSLTETFQTIASELQKLRLTN